MNANPQRLKELFQVASSALFDLHRYMEQCGDGFSHDVYRHRAELGGLIGDRVIYWERRESAIREVPEPSEQVTRAPLPCMPGCGACPGTNGSCTGTT